MNYLSFDSLVFYSFLYSFLRYIFNISILDNSLFYSLLRYIFNVSVLEDLWDVFSLVFDGVIVSYNLLFGNIFSSLNIQ